MEKKTKLKIFDLFYVISLLVVFIFIEQNICSFIRILSQNRDSLINKNSFFFFFVVSIFISFVFQWIKFKSEKEKRREEKKVKVETNQTSNS